MVANEKKYAAQTENKMTRGGDDSQDGAQFTEVLFEFNGWDTMLGLGALATLEFWFTVTLITRLMTVVVVVFVEFGGGPCLAARMKKSSFSAVGGIIGG